MGQSFSAQVFKVKVRMLPDRCTLCINKVTNQVKQERRKVATLLTAGEDESARFTAQGVMFLEKKIMIYRLLMLAGQHLGQNYGAIERARNECPPDLVDSCASLIYASQRASEVTEATDITRQLAMKFGEEWVRRHIDNHSGRVNPTLVSLFIPPNPAYQEMVDYLNTIAKEFNVAWKPKEGVWDPQVLGTIAPFPEPAALPEEYMAKLPSPVPAPTSGNHGPYSRPGNGYPGPVPPHAHASAPHGIAGHENCPDCLAGVPVCTDPNCTGDHPHIPSDRPSYPSQGGGYGGEAYSQPAPYPASGAPAPYPAASPYPDDPYVPKTTSSSSSSSAASVPYTPSSSATSYTPAAPPADVSLAKELPPPPTYETAVNTPSVTDNNNRASFFNAPAAAPSTTTTSAEAEEEPVFKLPTPPSSPRGQRDDKDNEGGQFDGLSEDDLVSRLKNL